MAFSGGVDAVSQLGVIHALLVSAGAAPNAVVGVSVGAVNAAALAEILQAGDPQARVDKLRKFLDSYLRVPRDILRSIFPDAFEITARRPLRALELPIHFQEERDDRKEASRSRRGLIYAMNKLFGLRLTVRNLTLAAHCFLELIAAADRPLMRRTLTRIKHVAVLWFLSARLLGLAPLFWSLVGAAVMGRRGWRRGATAWGLLRRPLLVRAGRSAGRVLGIVALAVLWLLGVLAPLLLLGWALAALAPRITSYAPVASVARWMLSLRYGLALTYVKGWLLAVALTLLPLLAPPLMRRLRSGVRRLLDRILEYHALSDGLGDTYSLKQQLVACFDREYYGKIEMDEVLRLAAKSGAPEAAASNSRRPKTFADYRCKPPEIQVGAVAADVSTGDLSVLSGEIPVVDALLAATARVPLFPAVEVATAGLPRRFFIDGGNVSREAVGPLLDLIRNEQRLDQISGVDVYPVHRAPGDAATEKAGSSLVKVALRALLLQRSRDATIEQRLTSLYSEVLPEGSGRVSVAGRSFVSARILPLAIESSLGLDMLSMRTGADLRTLVYQEVADGCRAALEGMIPAAIQTAMRNPAPGPAAVRIAASTMPPASLPAVPCRDAIAARLGQGESLPGSGDSLGPGLAEICKHCALGRPAAAGRSQQLRVLPPERPARPEWPLDDRLQGPALAPAPPGSDAPQEHPAQPPCVAGTPWPLERRQHAGKARPLVTLLFGGGVFRGVFHMGVLNALNELGVAPDLVAGSSVGSIVAAMIAQVFTLPDPRDRRARIARLAATFIDIDRLVLTDRMADFVRGFSVRAGDSNFSPRDLDLVLRRYDLDHSDTFGHRLRQVTAGLERLLYLSPPDLLEIFRSVRTRRFGKAARHLEQVLQTFLDRSGVGQEILGAEPLALLIRSHVLDQLAPGSDGLFSSFIAKGVFFLATATNLSKGQLEILGRAGRGCEISLLEGLLASSAFPAIFRPREAWEIFHQYSGQDRYFDGGIMDNLPLDAVAEFLNSHGGIARRPLVEGQPVPHLLFTASLEVDKRALSHDRVQHVSRSFLRLLRRARTFTYNGKIDAYAKVQNDLRLIWEARANAKPGWEPPLDLHVVAVKPQWLCDTFGFHPMLGFRRRKQAQSIAHGCASTLARLHAERGRREGAWTRGWGIEGLDKIDSKAVIVGSGQPLLMPQRKGKSDGECWFRHQVRCPFSRATLADLALEPETARQLTRIYERCGHLETHRPDPSVAAG